MMRCKNFCIYFATVVITVYVLELFFIDYLFPDVQPKHSEVRHVETPPELYLMLAVNTHTGPSSFDDIDKQVYKRFGYVIQKPTYPFLTLAYEEPINITQELADFISIESQPLLKRPPKFLPDNADRSFLLIKYSALSYEYSNDIKFFNENYSSWMEIDKYISSSPAGVVKLANDETALSMHHAFQQHSINGLSGIVISDLHPIVEIQALQNGAASIHSVGRRAHRTSDDRIVSVTGVEIAEDYESHENTFDFAATFGTIEHFGLGRYGDQLDSGSDLRWINLIQHFLKPGGLLYVGIPIGIDAIRFNHHRVYGVVRLPMLLVGFEWIATYGHINNTKIEISDEEMSKAKKFKFTRKTLVLRKL